MMVITLVTALATTVSVLTIDNLQSSWRAQQAGSALNAADAGVSRALSYLRGTGVAGFSCDTSPCGQRPGEDDAPLFTDDALPSSTGQSYQVWIQATTVFSGSNVGKYRIWSLGRAAGEAERMVRVDVEVQASDVPRGIFAKSITGNGDAQVYHESVFSDGCVWNRDKIGPSKTDFDLAYGIPAGVHSSGYVTTAKGSGEGCTRSQSVHASAACNSSYPFDHDLAGLPFAAGSACETAYNQVMAAQGVSGTVPFSRYYSDGSRIASGTALSDLFGIASDVPTAAQKDVLRSMAMSQGNYKRSASSWSVPDEDNAVLYFDLDSAGTDDRVVDLNRFRGTKFDPSTWGADGVPACPTRSLVIVIDGGNAQIGKNTSLAAAMFLRPDSVYGEVLKSTGNATFLGTIYARTINVVGTVDLSLSRCFLLNTSPALLDVTVGSYLEDDAS